MVRRYSWHDKWSRGARKSKKQDCAWHCKSNVRTMGLKMKNIQTEQKYKPGQYIVSLDHLMEQERIFFMGKVVNRSWFVNWQLWYAQLELSKLDIREAVKAEEEHETKN